MGYKVAVASSDGINVDTHFGHAESFIVFDVDESDGSFVDLTDIDVSAACSSAAQCGTTGCGNGRPLENDPMEVVAKALDGIDYVLVARIGPHAIQALARHGITAYDIVLPIEDAIKKINFFRQKIRARELKSGGTN